MNKRSLLYLLSGCLMVIFLTRMNGQPFPEKEMIKAKFETTANGKFSTQIVNNKERENDKLEVEELIATKIGDVMNNIPKRDKTSTWTLKNY